MEDSPSQVREGLRAVLSSLLFSSYLSPRDLSPLGWVWLSGCLFPVRLSLTLQADQAKAVFWKNFKTPYQVFIELYFKLISFPVRNSWSHSLPLCLILEPRGCEVTWPLTEAEADTSLLGCGDHCLPSPSGREAHLLISFLSCGPGFLNLWKMISKAQPSALGDGVLIFILPFLLSAPPIPSDSLCLLPRESQFPSLGSAVSAEDDLNCQSSCLPFWSSRLQA